MRGMVSPIEYSPQREAVISLLGEHCDGRLGGVARVHRLLERRPAAEIDIANYLRDVAEDAIAARGLGHMMELRFAGDIGCALPRDSVLSLGLIVREIIANSLKFAHPACVGGVIGLVCRLRAKTLTLRLSDDGVGLPEGFDPERDGRAGLRLVRDLAAKLGATVSFRSDALGSSFLLTMRTAAWRAETRT